MRAELHFDEESRLVALRGYEILDTPRESDFDDVVEVAAAIYKAPISVINLIDEGRQWFKAEVGLGVRETPLESSICAHAILQPGLFVVPDTTKDIRFCDNALVLEQPHLRFYAGALLETPDGLPLGTICVLDYRPRDLDADQRAFLRLMAAQVMRMLELRKTISLEKEAREHAEMLASENEILARESDHRVMNSLQLIASILSLRAKKAQTDETRLQLEDARNRVLAIGNVHQQLHSSFNAKEVDIDEFLIRICDCLKETAPDNVSLVVSSDRVKFGTEVANSLGLLVSELVTNSIKHAFTIDAGGQIDVVFRVLASGWRLNVGDNGRGLPHGFKTTDSKGIGMTVVRTLARRLNATLDFESGEGHTAFSVTYSAP